MIAMFISKSFYFQLFFTFFSSSLLYLRIKLIIENFKKQPQMIDF